MIFKVLFFVISYVDNFGIIECLQMDYIFKGTRIFGNVIISLSQKLTFEIFLKTILRNK